MTNRKTAKTAELFEFPTFDIAKIADSYREFTDKSVTQSKENYAKAKAAAEDVTKAMEDTLENAQAGTVELSLKAIDVARVSADNSFSHMEAMLGAKSVAQMIELQSAFVRKQAELMVDQGKQMQATGRKIAENLTKPAKAAAEKTANEIKAA